jgi:hypothetical protein
MNMKKILFLIIILITAKNLKAQNSNFNWVNTYKGGDSEGMSVAIDNQGFIYTTGSFQNTINFGAAGTSYTLTSVGSTDVFITKTDPLGNLIWAKRIGSLYNDEANTIIVDHLGNIIIGGRFTSQVDFNPGSGTFNMTVLNGMTSVFKDAFILKLDANGNFIWAKQLNYNIIDEAFSICEDKLDNLIVGGLTYTSPSTSAFIAKLNSSGSTLWSKVFYSPNTAITYFIDTDSDSNIYCSGVFNGKCTFGSLADTLWSQSNASFVCSLGSNGQFKWVKQAGFSLGNSIGVTLKVDNKDILNLTGAFGGTTILGSGVGSLTLTSTSGANIFLAKMDTLGTYLWAKQIGGNSGGALSYSYSSDSIGNQYISGEFSGTFDFDPGVGINNLSSAQGKTFFLKLDSTGAFIWVNQIGVTTATSLRVNSLLIDRNNNLFSIGNFDGTADFDASVGQYNMISPFNNSDVFLLRMGNCMTPIAPANTTLSSNLSVCPNITTTLSASGIGALSWYSSPTSTLSLATSSTFTTPPLATGTYTYYVESKICNSTSLRTPVTFTVVSPPIISLSPSSIGVCSPTGPVLITAGGAVTYTLNGYGAMTGNTVTVFPSSFPNTNYSITGKDVTGCVNTETIALQMWMPPMVNSSYAPILNSCNGNLVTYTLTASGALTYTWNPGNITGTSISQTPTVTTTYTVVGTDVNGCTKTMTQALYVYPSPTVTISGASSACATGTVLLQGNGANTYTWNTGSNNANIVVSPTTTATYTLEGKSPAGCLSSAVITVSVVSGPTLTVNNGNICIGQSFTINPSGANSYTFSGGSAVVSPTVTKTYTVTGSSGGVCSTTNTLLVIVNSLPTLTVTGTNTLCLGTSSGFIANGAATYTWNTGQTTSNISVNPNSTTIYTVMGTNMNGCINSQTASITVNNTCADIWPGDANSDGLADNLDVLELGLHYAQTGTPRASVSNNWQSYFSTNWTGTITNGKNLNHSDCNGDGIINDNDTLAIYTNYGLTHAFKLAQSNTINPQLRIVPDQIAVAKGTLGTASIYLGDGSTSINNVNGVAFTVDFDNALIETNNIYIEYQNSFLDAGQNLHFRKLDFSNGKIFTATTHTVNNNVSGNGLIAKLYYQIKSNLATDEILNIDLSQANQSNASGVISPLTSGTGTLMAIGASVGLQELNGDVISISPNPTNGSLTILSKRELQKTEVVSIIGQILLSEVPANVLHTLHLENFANGIYYVNIYQNNHIVKREKIVLNK